MHEPNGLLASRTPMARTSELGEVGVGAPHQPRVLLPLPSSALQKLGTGTLPSPYNPNLFKAIVIIVDWPDNPLFIPNVMVVCTVTKYKCPFMLFPSCL